MEDVEKVGVGDRQLSRNVAVLGSCVASMCAQHPNSSAKNHQKSTQETHVFSVELLSSTFLGVI